MKLFSCLNWHYTTGILTRVFLERCKDDYRWAMGEIATEFNQVTPFCFDLIKNVLSLYEK
jgi:hypothetical protein